MTLTRVLSWTAGETLLWSGLRNAGRGGSGRGTSKELFCALGCECKTRSEA